MEEAALYRAVLAAPHDDTPRLALADYLDESAPSLPEPQARLERGRAELIRVGCALARTGYPWHWGRPLRNPALDPELVRRAKRLRFLFSAKLRRGLPPALASARFDRGFLRPRVSVTPYQFLRDPTAADPLPPIPADHPLRRYAPGDDPFDACPLWDVHLYASGYTWDPFADRGQYRALLARCAGSPALARVGWLKVSFFQTPTLEFFRTGNFANVETLELNCGPFPEVLEAVATNESFRSLRYVQFGSDHWAWCPTPASRQRREELGRGLSELNARDLPYGEMRAALGRLLGGLRPIPLVTLPLRMPEWARLPEPAAPPPAPPVPGRPPAPERAGPAPAVFALCAFVFLALLCLASGGRRAEPEPVRLNFSPPAPALSPELQEIMKKWNERPKFNVLDFPTREVAPPPREVRRE